MEDRPVASQILMVWSIEPDTIPPLGRKATDKTASAWPVNVRTSRPSEALQVLTVLSLEALASSAESVLNARPFTSCEWAWILRSRRCVSPS